MSTDGLGGGSTGSGGSGGEGGGDGATGGSHAQAATTGDGTTGVCAEHSACTPVFETGRVLPAVCSGSEIEVALDAGCECDDAGAHHSVTWDAEELPDGMILDPNGALSGMLPAGTHEFRLSVTVDGRQITDEFELSVLDRCLILFATPGSTTGQPELAAARIDSGQRVTLGADSAPEGPLVRFDVSPNGRHVAEVVEAEGGRVLRLYALGATEGRHLALAATRKYVEHAFSRDSRWLGLVTTTDDAEPRVQIELIDLEVDPGNVVDRKDVAYQDGLTWSDAAAVLYRGPSSEDSHFVVAQERRVESTGFGSEEEHWETREYDDNEFYGFFVSDVGFMMLYESALHHFDRQTQEVLHHLRVHALSPDLGWVAQLDSKGLWVTSVAADSSVPTRRSGCDIVRAWSGDGSKLLCTQSQQLLVYDVVDEVGTLERRPLAGSFDGEVGRAAFSHDGRWLAFTPSDAGFLVLSDAEFETKPFDQPILDLPSGKNEWDYFFTPDGAHLVVQQGRTVLVASLGGKRSLNADDFRRLAVDVTLREVPSCNTGWFPDAESWCGAPRTRGNVLLSKSSRHIAFVSVEGVLQVASLDTGRVVSAGSIPDSTSSDAIAFQ